MVWQNGVLNGRLFGSQDATKRDGVPEVFARRTVSHASVHAERFRRAGAIFRAELPTPVPRPGAALRRLRANGVCYHDVLARQGHFPRTRLPGIIGHEMAGEVAVCSIAPAQTPSKMIHKLNAALNKALALPAVRDRLAQGASDVLGPTPPRQADACGGAGRARWVPFVRALRIDVE